MRPRLKITLFVAAALVAFGVLGASLVSRPSPEPPSFAQIDRLVKLSQEGADRRALKAGVPYESRKTKSHIHAAFRVSGAGTLWLAPEEMGLTETGRELAIHTHDATGVVHLHRPAGVKPFTVSQVLDVWGISGLQSRILINGRPGSPEYVLKDRDDVVLMVEGGPRLERFDWKAVPLEDS